MSVIVIEKVVGNDGSVAGNAVRSQGLTAEQIAALALTPAYSIENAVIGSVATFPTGFATLPTTGWMMVSLVSTSLGGVQCYMTLHSGNTTNSFGMRSIAANLPRVLLRANGVDEGDGNATSLKPLIADKVVPIAMTWQIAGGNLTTKLYHEGKIYTATKTMPTFSASFTELRIGSRNGGSDPLTGRIAYAEIGSGTYLSDIQLVAIAHKTRPVFVSCAGQSNMEDWEESNEAGTDVGTQSFLTTAVLGERTTVSMLNSAVGGSSIMKAARTGGTGDNYYWDEDTNSPGPNALAWLADVQALRLSPDWLLWDQGEAESTKIGSLSTPTVTKANYKASGLALFNWMRSFFPNMQIAIGILGIRTSPATFTNTGGIQTVVDVQNEWIAETPWIHFSHNRFDLALYTDGIHHTDASCVTMAARAARSFDRIYGSAISGGTKGPRLVSGARVATALTATISHDGGTDFTPTTLIQGFKYLDANGVDVPLSTISRASATTITMTLASDVAGTLYYMYDNDTISDLTKIVKDNGANTLPLRRGSVAVA